MIILSENKKFNFKYTHGDIMKKCDEDILNEFVKTRNLTLRTKHGYKDSLRIYLLVQEISFEELLEEAESEEEDMVRWKNRSLKFRLINFRIYLEENYLKSTARTHFQRIKTLYGHFEIEIHSLPPSSTKNNNDFKPISFSDLPSREIIKSAFEISNPIMRAMILFMVSSGCARKETLNLTIQDFIESTKEYHNETDIHEVLKILKAHDNVIPTFKLRRYKTDKFYFTFCSPEAVNEIINYLELEKRELKPNSPLFKINLDYLNTNFKNINDILNLGKVRKYRRFRSHMLRKFHASSLYNSENSLSVDEIDSLQGRSKNITRSSYFMEDPSKLKEKYVDSMDSIIILDKKM